MPGLGHFSLLEMTTIYYSRIVIKIPPFQLKPFVPIECFYAKWFKDVGACCRLTSAVGACNDYKFKLGY